MAQPGEEFHYSDLGFMLAGMAVARRFGRPLPDAMQALIRDRLGLTSLRYQTLGAMVEAIGMPREKLCTYCISRVLFSSKMGEENRAVMIILQRIEC